MNLLFDLDGTLTDPFQGITRCILHALLKLGRPLPPQESLRWCIGPPLKNTLAKLLDSNDGQLIDEALAMYRERFGVVGLFENDVYQDIPEVLDALDTFIIGDRKHDIIGARANKVNGLGVLWGYGTREELEESGAFTCINQPGNLISTVDTTRPIG